MNEKAEQRIAEAIENRSTHLNLGACGLTEIPPEIKKMNWLTMIHLHKY